jgi:hypothetical protein
VETVANCSREGEGQRVGATYTCRVPGGVRMGRNFSVTVSLHEIIIQAFKAISWVTKENENVFP